MNVGYHHNRLQFVPLADVAQTMVKDQPLRLIIQGQTVACMECDEGRTAVFFNVW